MKPEHLALVKNLLHTLGTPPEIVARMLFAAKDSAPGADSLIPTRTAAGLLGVHPKTVFRYRARGLLHPIKRSPRCIRWRRSEVETLAYGGPGND